MTSQEHISKEIESIEWLEPWRPCESFEIQGLRNVLAKEVGFRHPLFSVRKTVTPLARIDGRDDVLYLCDLTKPLAVVHLTWSNRRHWFSSIWPTTEFYFSVDDWISNCMHTDNREYSEL